MLTDAYFLSPDQKLAELASHHVPVFNFQLTFSGSLSFLPFLVGASTNKYPDDSEEAFNNLKPVHSDDTFYLFDIFGNRNENDEEMSKIMVEYWTNFAKFGHPSPFLDGEIEHWKPYSTTQVHTSLKV